jgi:hypothetical protein
MNACMFIFPYINAGGNMLNGCRGSSGKKIIVEKRRGVMGRWERW